jgi:hypothetical protein
VTDRTASILDKPAGGIRVTPPAGDVSVRKIDVSVCKVDAKLGLVFGYAIVCKVKNADGTFEPYYDSGTLDEDDGVIYSDHIPEDVMLEGVTDFMKSARVAGDMHERDENDVPIMKGTVVHSFPLTEDIAAGLGIAADKTGWLVAVQPEPEVFKLYQSGERKQFSIGGRARRKKEAA